MSTVGNRFERESAPKKMYVYVHRKGDQILGVFRKIRLASLSAWKSALESVDDSSLMADDWTMTADLPLEDHIESWNVDDNAQLGVWKLTLPKTYDAAQLGKHIQLLAQGHIPNRLWYNFMAFYERQQEEVVASPDSDDSTPAATA